MVAAEGPEMKLERIARIGVLGGGVMGGGIAQVMALGGFDVVVRDLSHEILDQTRDNIVESRWGLKRATELGKLDAEAATRAASSITYTTDERPLFECDLLIEAIPERLELKQQLFAELDKHVKPDAIFASNTSGFAMEELTRDISARRKRLFAGLHFFSPVPAMKLCEVIYTTDASSETIEAVRGVVERAGKIVVMVKDTPGSYGFLVNRIFRAARLEADKIVEAGIATREDIDKAMMYGRNWPVGFYNSRGTRTGWK
jgi:3-hydroxybutyryl-CoA dehydrogenase